MFDSSFVLPRYGTACFSDLAGTIKSLFSNIVPPSLSPEITRNLTPPYDTVVLFYVDAFGWRFFEEYSETDPFLSRMISDGIVAKITSQFPSTTSAHVTTIHSGLTVGQSQVFEWQYYEPHLDAMFSPLLFSYAGDKTRETVQGEVAAPSELFPTDSIYRDLRRKGVISRTFQDRAYSNTTFSRYMLRGSRSSPFTTFPQAIINLGNMLGEQNAPTYYFLYHDPIDQICHQHGPGSRQAGAEIQSFLVTMDRLFLPELKRSTGKTLFILTTDHGQIDVDPETTVYLNRDPQFSGIERYLRTGRNGQLLVPGGSPRDMFLYIKEGMLQEALTFLRGRLGSIADVHPVSDLISANLFGLDPPANPFLERAGELVIIPHGNHTVWWFEKGRFEMKSRGHHGGLSAMEMEIPLIFFDPDRTLGGLIP